MKQIYIIEDGHGHKKIGMSSNITRRITQLNTANPAGIISVMTSDFMQNAREIEKNLHEANKEYRINGEWFKEIVDFCDIEFSYIFMDVAEGAILLSQDFLLSISMDKEITGQTIRVLLMILSALEVENYITIKQVTIAKELGIQKSHVSKAMKQLVDKGIIFKVKEGTTTAYKLNPEYGWKGKVSDMDIERKRLAKQKVVDFKAYANQPKPDKES